MSHDAILRVFGAVGKTSSGPIELRQILRWNRRVTRLIASPKIRRNRAYLWFYTSRHVHQFFFFLYIYFFTINSSVPGGHPGDPFGLYAILRVRHASNNLYVLRRESTVGRAWVFRDDGAREKADITHFSDVFDDVHTRPEVD